MPRKIDLTGKIFGEWTVIREATKEEKEYKPGAYWICKCSCGTQRVINGQTLRNGDSKSCGCKLSEHLSKSLTDKNCIDITGKRFGYLTVIGRNKQQEEKHKNNTYWDCICDCGNKITVVRSSLIQGQTKSCGCLRSKIASKNIIEAAKKNYIDEIGNRYGKLTVIEKTEDCNGHLLWRCLCDCGNIIDVSSNSLRQGNTKSCGCLGRSSGEWKIGEILTKNNITFVREYPVIIGNRRFRFDFAVLSDNKIQYFIEYNGEQHYSPIDHFGGEEYFTYIQQNDRLKQAYCKENNIPLIIIKYTDYDKLDIQDLIL